MAVNTRDHIREAVLAAEAVVDADAYLWWPDAGNYQISRMTIAVDLEADLRSTPEGMDTWRRREREAAQKRRIFDRLYPSETNEGKRRYRQQRRQG